MEEWKDLSGFVQHGSKLLQVNIWDKVCVYDLLYFVTNILKDLYLSNQFWSINHGLFFI